MIDGTGIFQFAPAEFERGPTAAAGSARAQLTALLDAPAPPAAAPASVSSTDAQGPVIVGGPPRVAMLPFPVAAAATGARAMADLTALIDDDIVEYTPPKRVVEAVPL